MIVKMKKATILVLDSHKKETLTRLKELGVLHIDCPDAESEELSVLLEKRSRIERALKIIPLVKDKKNTDMSIPSNFDPFETSEQIFSLQDQIMKCKENLDRLNNEYETLLPWGDFNPEAVRELQEKGMDLHFCIVRSKDKESIPEELDYITIEKSKESERVVFIGDPGELSFSFQELTLPSAGLTGLKEMIAEKEKEYSSLTGKLETYTTARKGLEAEIINLDKSIEFEQIRAGMNIDEEVTYLTGFVPVDVLESLKAAGKKNGWGLVLESPKEDDRVPTLIKNPKWVSIINPVFDFFGTVPGYHETDISFWFLLFFSLFFAMIIGDAGYGVIILILTLVARLKMRKAPAALFILFTVMGIATVVWGSMTGTWFGVEQIARSPLFSWMIVDNLASFPEAGMELKVQQSIMLFCFTIAIVHLTIAHIINFLKQFPGLRAFSDIGKIVLLWGLYFLIQNIVFKTPLPPFAIWLVIAGFTINLVFIEQDGHFLKGLLSSLKNFIPIALNSISCFSDIISYA
ncbi:MAG: hypothetical protein JXJ04_27100, partial [Spirochaetales bacterium]|nr:hypothetical protein [Spirochaetales bacterium]